MQFPPTEGKFTATEGNCIFYPVISHIDKVSLSCMAKKNYTRLRLQAEEMFVEKGYTLSKIAEVLDVSPNTLTSWRGENDWDTLRDYYQNAPHRIERKLNKLMEQIIDGKDEMGNNLTPDQIKLSASKADAVSKIKPALALLNKETNPSTVYSVLVMLDNWISQNYPAKLSICLDIHKAFFQHIVNDHG